MIEARTGFSELQSSGLIEKVNYPEPNDGTGFAEPLTVLARGALRRPLVKNHCKSPDKAIAVRPRVNVPDRYLNGDQYLTGGVGNRLQYS